MGKKQESGPEWFKFWRRNRRQLDIEQLDMQSRGVVFTNMMRYFDGEDSALLDMTPIESMAFNVLKINVDDSFSEYAALSEQNRKNINKRWNRENTTVYGRIQPNTKDTEDRSQKTEVRGQKKEERSGTEAGKPPRTRFVPPTLEEVSIYCQQRGNTVDPQRFIDYYEANGWVQGKGKPIRDWQAAVRTWENGSMQKRQPTQEQPDLSWRDSRSVTLDDLVEYPANSGQYRPRSEAPHD